MHHPRGPEADTVAFSTKFFYGFGSVAEGVKNAAFNTFLLFYYNQVLGLPGTLGGAAIFAALCVDAITDPLVGSISDNTHSRLGRRHPYMYTSALPMALCFIALFHPPEGLGNFGLFAWLAIFAVGVRVSMTLYQIPSGSMVPELTDNYHERTTLVSYRYLFAWIGGLVIAIVGYRVYFAPSEGYSDGRFDPSAYGAFAITCACIVFGAILLSTLGTHKLIPTLKAPPERSPFTWARFAGELRDVFRSPSYRALVIGSLFAASALGFNDVVGLYVNTYFWGFSTQQISYLLFGLALGLAIAFAIARPLSERFDKRGTALRFAAFAIFFGPITVIFRLLGWMPENGDPMLLYLILGHQMVLVTIFITITILISSMIADTVDESELRTGKRQEGLFVSAIAFTGKAASGLGGFIAGVALDLIAFPRNLEAGMMPSAGKITALGIATGPGLMLLFVFTLYFISRYQLTNERFREIQAELARRRAETLDTAPEAGR